MTWTISKDFAFSASHQLHGLPVDHPCGRLHGHNYCCRVELTGKALTGPGFILDYGELRPFGQWIDAYLDHRHLNDVSELGEHEPTAEYLARVLAAVLRERVPVPDGVKVAVAVSETPKTWARWSE